MGSHLLYSVNPKLKLIVQQKYFGDVHYVWCADHWDGRKADPYTISSQVVPSSNPRHIYESLREAMSSGEQHSDRVTAFRAGYIERGVQQVASGQITQQEYDDIVTLVNTAPHHLWMPVLYLIPRHGVKNQLQEKPAKERAGIAPEYVIPDLRRDQFEVLEF